MRTGRHALPAGIALSLLAVGAGAANDPQAWLQRMAAAVQTTDYEGTVVRLSGDTAEAVKVIHSVSDGVIREKLIAQEGNGLEIIRVGNDVQCILPERQSVMVEEWSDQSTLFSTLPTRVLRIGSEYDLRVAREGRVAGRNAVVIAIKPHDEFRYEHRLWLDRETAFPLQTQLLDIDGNAVEQVKFADIELGRDIHDSALASSYDTAAFKWHNPPRRTSTRVVEADWRNDALPAGFRLVSAHQQESLPGTEQRVTHLLYSDGLASVSVFVTDDAGAALPERSQVGASNSFSTVVDGHRVTAVGEVPSATVERIATTMRKSAAE